MKTTNPFLFMLLSLSVTTAFTIPPQFAVGGAIQKTFTISAIASSRSNDYYMQTLEQARQVAYTSNSSPEEARKYLFEILHLQTGCTTGMYEDMDDNICENVQEMADLVANLRVKANAHQLRRETVLFMSLMISASLVSLLAWLIHPTDSVRLVLPFTPQEWMWSVRDGYLPTLLAQNWKYGGFLVDDLSDMNVVQPYLWVEWTWAVRDGYIPTMIGDWFRNGGL